MQKPRDFLYQEGQYLMVNVPSVSKHEWHPITVTSAPLEETITLHIQVLADRYSTKICLIKLTHVVCCD